MDRRTMLRGTLRATVGVGCAITVPGAVAGCKSIIHDLARPLSYPIYVPSLPPGVPSMIAARSAALGVPAYVVQMVQSSERASAFVTSGERSPSGGSGSFNPVTDEYPRRFDLAVVQTDASADAGARMLIRQGFKVVTYLAPLRYETAQITVDGVALGTLLAEDAARWAQSNIRGPATAVFVTSPLYQTSSPSSPIGTYLSPPPLALAAEQAIRATFARLLPSVTMTTTPYLEDPAAALRRDPRLRIVLYANDTIAAPAAQKLREQRPPNRIGRVYLGALGTPSVGSSQVDVADIENGSLAEVEQTLTELRRHDTLHAVATVRLSDLAEALVDLPVALLRDKRPYNIEIPPILLKPGSSALASYARQSAG
jgi:hypothetical protein